MADSYNESGRGGATIEVDCQVRNGRVMGRDGPLGQVFRNLIDNALTFSPEDGKVRIRLQRGHRHGQSSLLVRVEDEGPGIPEDNLETVFERFYTERPKGTAFGTHSGLGLAISRQIVQAHGGRITAANRRDADGQVAGACFTVELPAATSD